MKACEGKFGRIFVLRLEDGDVMPGVVEEFACEKGIKTASVFMLGGIGGGDVVVGPRDSEKMPPEPMDLPIDGAHEVAAVGLLAPNEDGKSSLHMHAALGRSGQTLTGCIRKGIKTWLVGEVVIQEIIGCEPVRKFDENSQFSLLEP